MGMKIRYAFFIALFGFLTVVFGDDITTTSGKAYIGAKVSRTDALGINITHKNGVARILFSEMSEPDKQKYGYDPIKEKEFYAEQSKRIEAQKQASQALAERRQQEEAKRELARQAALADQDAKRQAELERQEQLRIEMFKPSGLSVKEFHATRPQTPVVFKARAELDDYFNYDFSTLYNPDIEKIFWSIRLTADEGDRLGNGYILKAGRGESLFTLLKDGKSHPVIVRVHYPSDSDDSSVFHLDDYKELQEEPQSEDEW